MRGTNTFIPLNIAFQPWTAKTFTYLRRGKEVSWLRFPPMDPLEQDLAWDLIDSLGCYHACCRLPLPSLTKLDQFRLRLLQARDILKAIRNLAAVGVETRWASFPYLGIIVQLTRP